MRQLIKSGTANKKEAKEFSSASLTEHWKLFTET